MNKKIFVYFLSLFVISMIITGCGNTGTSSVKATQFGKTQKDISLLTTVTAKFGELGKGSTPRILSPLVTTSLIEFLPVDNVKAYSKDAKELHVWFIYDNFNNGDTGTITWKYLDTNEIIATDNIVLTTTSDMKFGRYNGNIIGPDGGWPVGKYVTVISIKGINATVYFEVVDGSAVTTNFELGDAQAPSINKPETTTTTSATYSDINYPFKIDYIGDYKYTVQSGDVIFKSPTKDMYYIVEVIQSTNTNGKFSSKEDVAADYYDRFSAYSPTPAGKRYASWSVMAHACHRNQIEIASRARRPDFMFFSRLHLMRNGVNPAHGEHAGRSREGPTTFVLLDDYLMGSDRITHSWVRSHRPPQKYWPDTPLNWKQLVNEYRVFTTDAAQARRHREWIARFGLPAQVEEVDPLWRVA